MYPVYGYGASPVTNSNTPDNVWANAPTPAGSVQERFYERFHATDPADEIEYEEVQKEESEEEKDAPRDLTKELAALDEDKKAEIDEGLLKYIEESSWFGTFFLFWVMNTSGKEEDSKNIAHKVGVRGTHQAQTKGTYLDGRNKARRSKKHRVQRARWYLRFLGSVTYPYVDLFLLLAATLIQPLLYAFFLWAIVDNLQSVANGISTRVLCPYPGVFNDSTGNALTMRPANTQENCMYCGLLWLYIVQLAAEIQNTREFIRISSNPEDSKYADEIELYECAEVYENQKLMHTLCRSSILCIFVDQLLHICGLCMLITVSMIAMFYQSGVGQMVLNATAVYCLEKIDDGFKEVLIKRQREHLEKYIENIDPDEYLWCKNEKRFKIAATTLQYLTILGCFAIIGFGFFLFVQTLCNCKPSVDIDLYKNVA